MKIPELAPLVTVVNVDKGLTMVTQSIFPKILLKMNRSSSWILKNYEFLLHENILSACVSALKNLNRSWFIFLRVPRTDSILQSCMNRANFDFSHLNFRFSSLQLYKLEFVYLLLLMDLDNVATVFTYTKKYLNLKLLLSSFLSICYVEALETVLNQRQV